jgi:ATP-binding cassette subfamily B protein
MHATRIVAMEAGQIVEIGTHLELLERNGHYARLYQLGLG